MHQPRTALPALLIALMVLAVTCASAATAPDEDVQVIPWNATLLDRNDAFNGYVPSGGAAC